MVGDLKAFIAVSIPAMLLFGMRHALDVDHITAIDNLVRLHNARKKARWVGTGFSIGHMTSVLGEMLLIIYTIGEHNEWQSRPAFILGRCDRSDCFSDNWSNQYLFNEKMG